MCHLGQLLYHVLLVDLDMIFLKENFQICFFIPISKHLNQDQHSTLLFSIDEILFSLFNYHKGKLEIHIYRGANPQERFPRDFWVNSLCLPHDTTLHTYSYVSSPVFDEKPSEMYIITPM